MRSTCLGSIAPGRAWPHLDVVAVGDEQPGPPAHRIGVLLATVVRGQHDPASLVGLLDLHAAGGRRSGGDTPGRAGLEQLDDTRQTLHVMSSPATPPVWNVRIVSCVPGSPID